MLLRVSSDSFWSCLCSSVLQASVFGAMYVVATSILPLFVFISIAMASVYVVFKSSTSVAVSSFLSLSLCLHLLYLSFPFSICCNVLVLMPRL